MNKKTFLIILSAVLIGLSYLVMISSPVYDLKHNDNLHLICNGKEVSKNLIIDYISEKDMYIFKNGYSQNCYVVDESNTIKDK